MLNTKPIKKTKPSDLSDNKKNNDIQNQIDYYKQIDNNIDTRIINNIEQHNSNDKIINKPTIIEPINNILLGGNNNQNKIYDNQDKITWDDNSNCYIFFINNKIENTLNNEIILKNILGQEIANKLVNEYIFELNWNEQNQTNEFSFKNSIFMNNLDITIRLQNFIYDTLMNFDNLNVSDPNNYFEIILYFYYQFIIFLFNNYNLYLDSNDINKISRLYSSLSFRFGSLILKNILKIKMNIDENNELINKLINIKMNISNNEFKYDEIKHSDLKNQFNCAESDLESLTDLESDFISEPTIVYMEEIAVKELNVKNKNGDVINKINDVFSANIKVPTEINKTSQIIEQYYDSDNNGYCEIKYNNIPYKKISYPKPKPNPNTNTDNSKIKFEKSSSTSELDIYSNYPKQTPTENSNLFNTAEQIPLSTNKSKYPTNPSNLTNTNKLSYNPNSAILNGKIYQIVVD